MVDMSGVHYQHAIAIWEHWQELRSHQDWLVKRKKISLIWQTRNPITSAGHTFFLAGHAESWKSGPAECAVNR